jgi:uncharacterized membrane protein
MRFDDEILIDAPADDVWTVYSDVEHWPDWTSSVHSVEYVDGDTLALGARARIKQPKLPTAVWQVSVVEPGRSWTWVASGPGMRTTAVHTLEAEGEHKTRVHQTIEQHGPLGAIFGRVYARLTREYLATEAAGLKQRCEARV